MQLMTKWVRPSLLVLTIAAGACSAMAAAPTTVADTAKGKTLVDAKGMTLYTFAKDADGKSACNGPCATNWPPLKADDSMKAADGYSIVTRDDGSKQVAYKGKPLYTWSKDTKPGDITGDGFLNGAWHVAQP
jgi:predicted lipoprotein with Yx(FWY)xxD motif